MSVGVQAILLGLLGFCANAEWFLGTCLIQRPIILGPLAGLIMGDLHMGVIMGATMELAFAGAASIGAYDPPDTVSGTILGVALALKAGAGPEMALTLGIPVASVVLAVSNVTGYPILQFFAHLMDRDIAKGNDKAFQRNFILSGFVAWGITTPIIPIAYYLGADRVTDLVKVIPEFVQTGMEIAGGLLPAMGFAMLAQAIMKKKLAPFFFIGYFIVAFSGVSTTGVSIFAILILAAIFGLTGEKGLLATPQKTVTEELEGGDFDEF